MDRDAELPDSRSQSQNRTDETENRDGPVETVDQTVAGGNLVFVDGCLGIGQAGNFTNFPDVLKIGKSDVYPVQEKEMLGVINLPSNAQERIAGSSVVKKKVRILRDEIQGENLSLKTDFSALDEKNGDGPEKKQGNACPHEISTKPSIDELVGKLFVDWYRFDLLFLGSVFQGNHFLIGFVPFGGSPRIANNKFEDQEKQGCHDHSDQESEEGVGIGITSTAKANLLLDILSRPAQFRFVKSYSSVHILPFLKLFSLCALNPNFILHPQGLQSGRPRFRTPSRASPACVA